MSSAQVLAQELQAALLALPESDREPILLQECSGQPDLLEGLRRLLRDPDFDTSELTPFGADVERLLARIAPGRKLLGTRVGAYRLLEEIGRGGMGVVYRAERADGVLQRQVAIKLIRRELLTAELQRRFLAERQTLAAMDHPHIARLLDAAELEDGTPYFVMEFVDGENIAEYCDRLRLDFRQRLLLFRTVCEAVAHAHRNLVVHRDLKPGNILVTRDGAPKLLDFGIAKPLIENPRDPAAYTATAQRFFSPNYAAPEQFLGHVVGVGCDVYALGLLLFELLTGTRPFAFGGLSPGRVERIVTSVPAPQPSTVVRDRKTARLLRGDLDGIVLRCLRKSPAARYVSVEQLDADVQNYLDGRPVKARGGHRWYRAQKFVQRNLGALIGASALGVAVIVGVAAVLWQYRVAQQRADELELVAGFQAEMLGQVKAQQLGQSLTLDVLKAYESALQLASLEAEARAESLRDFTDEWRKVNSTSVATALIDHAVLKPAVAALEDRFKAQPMVDARLRSVVADQYVALGLLDAAIPLRERAIALHEQHQGAEHRDTLAEMGHLALLHLERGDYEAAEKLQVRVLESTRRQFGEQDPDTLASMNELGALRTQQSRLDEAEELLTAALSGRIAVLGADAPATTRTRVNLAVLYQRQGRLDRSERELRAILETRTRQLGADHEDTLSAAHNLALSLYSQTKYGEASTVVRATVDHRRRKHGDAHPSTLGTMLLLAAILRFQGDEEAESLLLQIRTRATEALGPYHPHALAAGRFLGLALLDQNRIEEAYDALRRSYEDARKSYGDEHHETLQSKWLVGILALERRQLDEAAALLSEVHATFVRTIGEETKDTLSALIELARLRLEQSENVQAADMLQAKEAVLRKTFAEGVGRGRLSEALTVIGRSLQGSGAHADAERYLIEAQELQAQVPTGTPYKMRDRARRLVELYVEWEKTEPAPAIAAKRQRWESELAALESAAAALKTRRAEVSPPRAPASDD